jgi:acyl-CoA-dependent ceramide synthase
MSLQSLNLFWLMAILRIAFKFVFSGEAKDDRSDYEEEEDDLQDADMAAREQLKREATPTPPVLQLNGNTVEEPLVKATGTEKKRASRRKA